MTVQNFSIQDFNYFIEGQDIECKAAQGQDGKGEIPKDFWKTYSAMANTEGGIVWLGIQEKPSGYFRPIGIQNPQKIIQDLWNNLNNRKQVSLNLLTNSDIHIVQVDGKSLVQVNIPRAERHQRPVFIGENSFGGTFLRRNEGDYQADDETVRRIIVEKIEDSRDERILKGFSINDLDLGSIEAYRNRFSAVRPNHVWLDLPLMEFLVCIGAFGTNRETGESGLRLAGLLMFGRGEVIVDALPHYMLDFQERPEAKTERRWIDRITPDGTWSGNVYDFFKKVYSKLVKDLPIPFQLNQGQRIEDTPVHTAIREALVNALVHADYSGRMSILVVKRPDLFGFRNPGLMRVPLRLALQGGHSDCRNRRLQTMFQLVGYGDKAGSGIPSILYGWKEQHWRRPLFQQIQYPEQTLITLKMASLLPKEATDALQEHLGDRFTSLSPSERSTVVTAYVEGYVNHARVKEICTEHSADITKMLSKLVGENLLKSYGKGRGKTYHLPWRESLHEFDELIEVESSDKFSFSNNPQLGSLEPKLGSLEPKLGSLEPKLGSLEPKLGSLEPKLGSLEPKLGSLEPHIEQSLSIIYDKDQLTHDDFSILENIAQQISLKERCPPEIINQTILLLCESKYLGARFLSQLLNRDSKRLVKKFLNPLVEQKKLHRAFPNPNHPRQAYQTVKDD